MPCCPRLHTDPSAVPCMPSHPPPRCSLQQPTFGLNSTMQTLFGGRTLMHYYDLLSYCTAIAYSFTPCRPLLIL